MPAQRLMAAPSLLVFNAGFSMLLRASARFLNGLFKTSRKRAQELSELPKI
jgi:hypothetical protein